MLGRQVRIGATGAVIFGLFACMPPPVHTTLPSPTLRLVGEQRAQHDGITVEITAVTSQNASQFPEIWKTLTLHGAPVRGQPTTTTATGSIVPLPAFKVVISNSTGHAIRLTQSVIRLQDNLNRHWNPMATNGDVLAWAQATSTDAIALDPTVTTQLTQATSTVPLLTPNVQLLNGDSNPYYLVFQGLPVATAAEERTFLDSVTRLTVRIAEVPVETNEAGVVSRTTEFSFDFDRTSFPRQVVCPGGTTQPSWDACQAG